MNMYDIDVLALIAVAGELWDTASTEYIEGDEDLAITRARLTLHAHAIELIQEKLNT